MRFQGVLVRPLDDQRDRDGTRIDPAGVQFEEGRDYPLWVEFDYARPLGYAVVSRADDGSLVVAGAITEADPDAVMGTSRPRLAAGVTVEDMLADVVRRCRLTAVALTAEHADPDQPPIEEVP